MHNDFEELEQQVEKLIQLSERLNHENRHLRKQQVALKRARAELLKQRDDARQQLLASTTMATALLNPGAAMLALGALSGRASARR